MKCSEQDFENPNGKWRLDSSSYNCCWNCFSEPNAASHLIIHTFQSGDVVEVAMGVQALPECKAGCNWCLLTSPAYLKGAYICLAPASGEPWSWYRLDVPDDDDVQSLEDAPAEEHGEEWVLVDSSWNCRSKPNGKGQIILVFKRGVVVVVKKHVGKDWCLLASPPSAKGAYIRLRNGNASRSWRRVGVAADNPVGVADEAGVESLEEDQDIHDEARGEEWSLVADSWNCRSKPNATGKIIHVFQCGDVVVVEKHVGADWCLLASPPSAEGAYIRLRNGNASRSWRPIGVDAYNPLSILFVAHVRSGGAPDVRYANWLRSSDRDINVSVQNYKKVNWLNDFEGYDAIVLSGGSGIEDEIWAKEKAAIVATSKPVFGICLGMQFLCKAYWDSEHPDGPRLTLKRVHDTRALRPEQLDVPELGLKGKIAYFRMFGVPPDRVADSLNILCLSDAGDGPTVGIVKHKTKLAIGFQGHAEMTASDVEIYSGALKIFFSMIDEYRMSLKEATSENSAGYLQKV